MPMDDASDSDDGASGALRPRQVELLAKLETFFFVHGYRDATMDRLAQELRCSKRALYELAPNRKELFALVVDRWTRRIRTLGAAAVAQHGDPRARLKAYLEPGIRETVGITDAFLTDLRELSSARAILEAHQRERMATLRLILDDGVRDGAFRDVHAHLVAGICLAGLEKINEPDFLRQAAVSFSAAFAELYRLLIDGLGR